MNAEKSAKNDTVQSLKEEQAAKEHVHGPNCNHGHHELKPIVRQSPKVGRNEPCLCGSTKKFKKCCGKA